MRANIFIICLIATVLTFAFCASPSLAKTGTIDLVQGQTTHPNGELAGVNVTVEDGSHKIVATAISDSTGNFSIANVSDGGTGRIRVLVAYVENGTTYNATKVNPTWYPSNLSIINVSPSDTRVAIYKPSQAGTSVGKPFTAVGQVTDARGNGVAGANVTLIDGNYQVIGTNTTSQDGNFGFTNVVASTPDCKVQVVYNTTDGKSYRTYPSNVLWYSTASGLIKFSPQDTQLTDYPELGNTGYVWGSITDASGNLLTGVVYLASGTANLSIPTYDSAAAPGFISEVPAGNYTAYAEHVDANGSLKSKPVPVEVQPALRYLDTNAITFVADQATPSVNVTPTAAASASQPAPFVNPALLVVAMIVAVFAAGAADRLKSRK